MSTAGKHKRNEFVRLSVAGMPGYCAKPKCMRKCKAGHDHEQSTLDACHEGKCWPSEEQSE